MLYCEDNCSTSNVKHPTSTNFITHQTGKSQHVMDEPPAFEANDVLDGVNFIDRCIMRSLCHLDARPVHSVANRDFGHLEVNWLVVWNHGIL